MHIYFGLVCSMQDIKVFEDCLTVDIVKTFVDFMKDFGFVRGDYPPPHPYWRFFLLKILEAKI